MSDSERVNGLTCPKCGRNDNIKYRVSFYDDDERGKFYIRVDGSRNSTKKVKWYDNYFDALRDMKNKLPCAYPYFQMVEGICCNEFLFSNGHIEEAHKEALEINKHQARLDKVLSKFEGSEEDTKYYNIIETEQTMINITYREKIFALELFNKNNDDIDDEVISLDTVESLLKDLGKQDD